MNFPFRSKYWPFAAAMALLLSGCVSTPFRDHQLTTAPRTTAQDRQEIIDQAVIENDLPAPEYDRPDVATDEPDLEAPTDIWQHISQGYGMAVPDHPRLKHEIQWLQAHPNYLLHASERAAPYLHYIVEEADRRNLPLELALLPVIESGFNPKARSRLDAGGLWQFMPPTAEAFGLKQNWWYDGRFDIHASTTAALDYLEQLADQFDGDWALALSAYNAGPSTVRRAIAHNRAQGLPTDYWSIELPRETGKYVPRLLAVAQAVQTPGDFGIELADIPNQPRLARVELPRQIDLRIASELADLDSERLLRLNPGYRRWATAPEGPHDLLLPLTHVETFDANLKQLDDENWIRTQRHLIRPGETLNRIAQRYGTDIGAIRKLNNMSDNRIRAGKYLLVPEGDSQPAVATAQPATYLVQAGDTLWEIARAHNLNYRQLAAWNGLAVNATLRPGQKLGLSATAAANSTRSLAYRVRSGDSLYVIAQRFGVKISDLKRWNRFDSSHLQPGQTLTLYLQPGATSQL